MAPALPAIAIGATVAGGVVKGFGDILSGDAQANMYNYQAGVAQADAKVKEQDANYALAVGGIQAQEAGMAERFKIGQTRVGFGASNVGGAVTNRVLSSEIQVGQEQQGIVQSNAAQKAYGFQVQAVDDIAQAGADEVAANTAHTASEWNLASTILGTVGSVASKWTSPAFGSGQGSASASPTGDFGQGISDLY